MHDRSPVYKRSDQNIHYEKSVSCRSLKHVALHERVYFIFGVALPYDLHRNWKD